MGIVYKARQRYLDREVAIKVLHASAGPDSPPARRFLVEARAASSLTDPHTVTIHDFGVTPDGMMYFVMEMLAGDPLSKVIRDRGALPYDRAVNIARQVCDSLAEAHVKGIVHRDLKPDNLFVFPRSDGTDFVKVLDFGIAKIMDSGERLTSDGKVLGTPEYMSPEQAQGLPLTPASDLYSLGIVLYEMLAGQPPFTGPNPVNLLMAQATMPPPPLSEKNPKTIVPPSVDRLLSQLLDKDPAARPPSAKRLGEMLTRALLTSGPAVRTQVLVDDDSLDAAFEETTEAHYEEGTADAAVARPRPDADAAAAADTPRTLDLAASAAAPPTTRAEIAARPTQAAAEATETRAVPAPSAAAAEAGETRAGPGAPAGRAAPAGPTDRSVPALVWTPDVEDAPAPLLQPREALDVHAVQDALAARRLRWVLIAAAALAAAAGALLLWRPWG
jgi:serine/threonine-protein kinase